MQAILAALEANDKKKIQSANNVTVGNGGEVFFK